MTDQGNNPDHEFDPREERLSKIMKKSLLQMPFSDFEDTVMWRIQNRARYRDTVFKDVRLSSVFFLLGTGFGLLLNAILSKTSGNLLPGLSSERALLFFQVLFVFFLLTQLEKIIRLILKIKNI